MRELHSSQHSRHAQPPPNVRSEVIGGNDGELRPWHYIHIHTNIRKPKPIEAVSEQDRSCSDAYWVAAPRGSHLQPPTGSGQVVSLRYEVGASQPVSPCATPLIEAVSEQDLETGEKVRDRN